MPHYKDGTAAQIGDLIKGKPYNTDHEIVGQLVQITPGSDSCNCIVAFADTAVVHFDPIEFNSAKVMLPVYLRRQVGGIVSDHPDNLVYENLVIVPCYDYGELRAFLKV